jgi:hypothetical protein
MLKIKFIEISANAVLCPKFHLLSPGLFRGLARAQQRPGVRAVLFGANLGSHLQKLAAFSGFVPTNDRSLSELP